MRAQFQGLAQLGQRTAAGFAVASGTQVLLGAAVELPEAVGDIDLGQVGLDGFVVRIDVARDRGGHVRTTQRLHVVVRLCQRIAAFRQYLRQRALQAGAGFGVVLGLLEHGEVQRDRRFRVLVQAAFGQRRVGASARLRQVVGFDLDLGAAPGQAPGQTVVAADGHAAVARGSGVRGDVGRAFRGRIRVALAAGGECQRQQGRCRDQAWRRNP